ncbi:MAG: ROK family protein [Verrucomicrobia bacterium]|nr:ROK family protein [Verrucomicrobiota bacterium]
MNPSPKAIGIDIGGTKIAAATVNAHGTILARATLPTEAEQGFPRAVARLAQAVDRLLQQAGCAPSDLAGVGIGCAGPVDPAAGLINNPFTLAGWNRCDVVSPLRQRFGVPVWLENDADAAALGECWRGAAQGLDPVVMLTFGTGIGGGVIAGGEIYRGADGEHPELGHVPVDPAGPPCYCGTRGCLESLASGTAIGKAGQTAGLPDAPAVFAAATRGHDAARHIVERARHAAATAAWTLFHTFLPKRLVLGGGIMNQHFSLFATAIDAQLRHATQFTRSGVTVARAALGNDAGLVGAAALVFRRMATPVSQGPSAS